MSKAVFLLDKIGPQAAPILEEAGFRVVNAGRGFNRDVQALSQAIKEQFALGELVAVCLRSSTQLGAEAMAILRQAGVELIVRCGAGFDNLDLASARASGIIIENTPGRNATSVAEKTLICAGLLCHRVSLALAGQAAVSAVQQFASEVSRLVTESGKAIFEQALAQMVADLTVSKADCVGTELYGKTMGVIGYRGAIGTKVARRAMSLGMQVVGFDPAKKPEVEGVKNVRVLSELLAQSDFVTVHVPLTSANQGLIGSEEIDLMKPGAFLLNLARAGIVDLKAVEADLCSSKGRLGGYASDVDDPKERIFRHPRTLVLPHIGAATVESEARCAEAGAEHVLAWVLGGEIIDGVNFHDASILADRKNGQLTVIHRDMPGLIESLSGHFAGRGINIGPSVTKPSNGYACTLIGPDVLLGAEVVDELSKIAGVVRVIPLSPR